MIGLGRSFVRSVIMIAIPTALAFSQQGPPPGPQGMEPGQRRQMLEQRLRERIGEVVKRRLQLTDDQMAKLQNTNRQFEPQRASLLMKERDVRRELRQQLMSGTADQNRVGVLLDQAMQLERQRLDLTQNEQREMAKFMTPVQRAKLFGLQNEMRRRAQELRNRQQPGGPGAGGLRGQMRPPR